LKFATCFRRWITCFFRTNSAKVSFPGCMPTAGSFGTLLNITQARGVVRMKVLRINDFTILNSMTCLHWIATVM
jgi:hypothetical protein